MALLLPNPIREKRLREIQKRLAEHKEEGSINALGKAVKRMLEDPGFPEHIAATPALRAQITGEASLMRLAWGFLYRQLNTNDLAAAAMMLYDEETFTIGPRCVRLIWDALMTKRMIVIIGGGGLSKSYSPSVFFLLQWLTDPEYTRFQIASASEDHLRKNLFADINRLYTGASMVLPGKLDTESVSLDKKRAFGIFTMTLPGGPQSKGKIRGAHTKPRPNHPKFGRRSRVFCLIDESQQIPQNTIPEIPNRFSTVVGDDVEHIKFVLCANPLDVFSNFGACAKPAAGWESIHRDDEVWESEEGWTVVSLDAMRHENVVQKKVIYPGFVTWDGVQNWIKKCHGNLEDPMMYSFVFGKFPLQALASTVIRQQWLLASEGTWEFDSQTVAVAGADPAFVGDRPTLATGRVGRAIAWIDYHGERHVLPTPAWKIQMDAVAVLPRGDLQDLSDECMSRLKLLGVEPNGFGVDMTGVGRGVHDLIRRQWSDKVKPLAGHEFVGTLAPIHGLEFGSLPTTLKIADEDSASPREMFNIMASEIWYAAAKLFEFDVIRIGKGVDLKVFAELAARQGGLQPGLGKKLAVESKRDFKTRTGMDSPDLADAALICISVARWITPELLPCAKDTTIPSEPREQFQWGREPENAAFPSAELAGFEVTEIADVLKD